MTDTQGTTEQGTEEQGENANLKHLRERADQAGQFEAEAKAARRELAVLKSGIDADHPMGKFFLEHYEGDITDTVALTEQAKAMGIPIKGAPALDGTEQSGTQEQDGQQEQSQERRILEPTGTEQRRALAGEDPNLGEVNPDPRKVALDQSLEAIDKGATQEQAGGHFVSQMARAASLGDTRVIVQEQKGSDGKVRQRWQQ